VERITAWRMHAVSRSVALICVWGFVANNMHLSRDLVFGKVNKKQDDYVKYSGFI